MIIGIVIVGYQWVDVGICVQNMCFCYDRGQFFFFMQQDIDFICGDVVVVYFIVINMGRGGVDQ